MGKNIIKRNNPDQLKAGDPDQFKDSNPENQNHKTHWSKRLAHAANLLPVLPAATLKRDAANCPKKCNVCQQNCPVSLKLEDNASRGGECIRCGKCAVYDIQSVNIRSFGTLNGTEIWLVILKAALFFGIGTALGLCRFF